MCIHILSVQLLYYLILSRDFKYSCLTYRRKHGIIDYNDILVIICMCIHI